jgi:hypothetical protein
MKLGTFSMNIQEMFLRFTSKDKTYHLQGLMSPPSKSLALIEWKNSEGGEQV